MTHYQMYKDAKTKEELDRLVNRQFSLRAKIFFLTKPQGTKPENQGFVALEGICVSSNNRVHR